MARSALAAVDITDTGYNLTDSAAFVALSTGANNGKEIVYNPAAVIVLKNTTGGNAVYTIKIVTPPEYTAIGLTLSDMTVTVATLKTWVMQMKSVMRQADGKVYIDCDVAGSLLVLA
jgi:hypothetical protein